MALVANTFSMVDAANGRVSIDPAGSLANPIQIVDANTPIVSLQSDQDRIVAAGTIVTTVFTSNVAGCWIADAVPDSATFSTSFDRRTFTITWSIPAGARGHSRYIGARCIANGAIGRNVARVHVGITKLVKVGQGVGYDYATWNAAVAAETDPGVTFVQKDGVYTTEDQIPHHDSGNMMQSGEHTVDQQSSNVAYSVNLTKFTTLMAETPFGVIYDRQHNAVNGFASYGLMIQGDLRGSEMQPWVNAGWSSAASGSGVQKRGLAFKGFVLRNARGPGWAVWHTDHIHLEFCGEDNCNFPNDGTNKSADYAFTHRYTARVLLENCFANGAGRAGPGRFKNLDSVVRRCLMRRDFAYPWHSSVEPFNGDVCYLAQGHRTSDIIHFDGDSTFWKDLGPFTGPCFADPSTTNRTYARNNKRKNCMIFDSDYGILENDANLITDEAQAKSIIYENILAINCRQRSKVDSSLVIFGPMFGGGSMRLSKCSPVVTGPLGCFIAFGSEWADQKWNKNILADLGWNPAVNDTENVGYLISSTYDSAIEMTDTIRWNWKGQDFPAGELSDGSNYTGRDDINPYTNGWMYPDRIEEGSVLDTQFQHDTRSWLLACGELGALSGDQNFDHDFLTNRFWLNHCYLDKMAEFFRGYSYTGPEGTLSGDRGLMQSGSDFVEEILSKFGNTPYPTKFNLNSQTGDFGVSIPPLSNKFKTNINEIKVVLNGIIETSLNGATTYAEFRSMVSGHTYKVQLKFVDSVIGESGLSEPLLVTA